jgi:folate-binding protein YgfZ
VVRIFAQPREAAQLSRTGVTWVALEDTGMIGVRGPDARAFLQGQLTNDVPAVTAGRSSLGAFATAQGRVAALVRVLALADGMLLVLPRTEAQALRDRLARHVLRAKVELTDESDDWSAVGLLDAAGVGALAAGAGALPAEPDAVGRVGELIVVALDPAPRVAVVASRAAIATLITALPDPAAPFARWRLTEIALGRPDVVAETRELFIPQALNLDLLGAVSFRKGCYTGQEIIARTQHLGRVRRRMFRARADSPPPAPGTPVLARGEVTGHVVSAEADGGNGCELLATLGVDDRDETLCIGGGPPLERLPLPYLVPELDRPQTS